jgi:hypothetical protein
LPTASPTRTSGTPFVTSWPPDTRSATTPYELHPTEALSAAQGTEYPWIPVVSLYRRPTAEEIRRFRDNGLRSA